MMNSEQDGQSTISRDELLAIYDDLTSAYNPPGQTELVADDGQLVPVLDRKDIYRGTYSTNTEKILSNDQKISEKESEMANLYLNIKTNVEQLKTIDIMNANQRVQLLNEQIVFYENVELIQKELINFKLENKQLRSQVQPDYQEVLSLLNNFILNLEDIYSMKTTLEKAPSNSSGASNA